MTNHDYLVLSIAALWLLTNFCGVAFTLRHLQNRGKQSAAKTPVGKPPKASAVGVAWQLSIFGRKK